MKDEANQLGQPPRGGLVSAPRPQAQAEHRLTEAVQAAIHREFGPLSKRQPRLFQLVLNDAAALAWWTPFPHLFFPTLAFEKLEAVARWDARQRAILGTGLPS